jgi:hypothetical protein
MFSIQCLEEEEVTILECCGLPAAKVIKTRWSKLKCRDVAKPISSTNQKYLAAVIYIISSISPENESRKKIVHLVGDVEGLADISKV